ncbi:hypothetical protein [Roseibium sp. M-1]
MNETACVPALYINLVSVAGSWAAIITAIVAFFGYGAYRCDIVKKRLCLEKYLKSEQLKGSDKGQRSILHIVARIGMTETEILQASFRSKHILRKIASNDGTGRAEAILIEWVE